MLGLDDDDDPLGIQDFVDRVSDLGSQALLDLRAARVAFDHAGQLGQARHDAAARDVAHVGAAVEGQQVVLAHREEGDVADQDQLVGARVELGAQMLTRVLGQALAHLAPRARHAVGGADQALALGVLTDCDEQVARRLLNASGIVGHACSSSTPEASMTSIGDTSIPCTGTDVHSSSDLIPTGWPKTTPGTAASDW